MNIQVDVFWVVTLCSDVLLSSSMCHNLEDRDLVLKM
jgi:hypothetical protein